MILLEDELSIFGKEGHEGEPNLSVINNDFPVLSSHFLFLISPSIPLPLTYVYDNYTCICIYSIPVNLSVCS